MRKQPPAKTTPAQMLSKVPKITPLFWVIKILTTGMGESLSDGLGNASIVIGGAFILIGFYLAMRWQFKVDRYHAPTYWFAVSMVAVFGTVVADVLHDVTSLSYYITSVFYAGVVAFMFYKWYATEGTLSIHHIDTKRREKFYWGTVLATFALGTAVGDLTGLTLHLGFFAAGLLFIGLILLPLIAWRFGANATVCFWTAYVLTRPLGASFADWIAKPHATGGGLGFGDLPISGLLIIIITILVIWAHRSRHDIQDPVPEFIKPTD